MYLVEDIVMKGKWSTTQITLPLRISSETVHVPTFLRQLSLASHQDASRIEMTEAVLTPTGDDDSVRTRLGSVFRRCIA
jgi:hypothetical protein